MAKLKPPKLMSRASKIIVFDKAKSVTWDNKIQNEGNMARNDYHFADDESLKEAIQDIKDKIKRCRTSKTIIDLLDNAISTNKKVLEADYQFLMHYLNKHLNTDTLTMDLLENNQTVKNLHDLVRRHGEFGNFLAKQIKHYKIIQSEQTEQKPPALHIGKPWEANFNAVVACYPQFKEHYTVLLDNGYITIKDNKFLWNRKKASEIDLARYFLSILAQGRKKADWICIINLFDIYNSNNTLRQYSLRKDPSPKLEKIWDLLKMPYPQDYLDNKQ